MTSVTLTAAPIAGRGKGPQAAPCEHCHGQPGEDFVDCSWLCGRCKRGYLHELEAERTSTRTLRKGNA